MASERTTSFFAHLAQRLIAGRQSLPLPFVERLRRALLERRDAHGSFRGPDLGKPDLYYTGFGCRCLEILGHPDLACETWSRLMEWLPDREKRREFSMTDVVSLVEIARICDDHGTHGDRVCVGGLTDIVRRVLNRHRVGDHGFSRVAGGSFSTYGTFLGVAANRSVGFPAPLPPPAVRRAVRAQQRPDGGFAESAQVHVSGTSPTAAGIALLWETGGVPASVREEAARFLEELQVSSGGIKSHAAARDADLLSTFTALTALDLTGRLSRIRRGGAVRFARAMLRADGVFAASASARQTDVEYMYYGIGVPALLAASLSDGTA